MQNTREIKFKAWLPTINKMTKSGTIEDIVKWAPFGSTPVWLQYTGLKDKNGKEIYAGDIVERLYKYEIVFDAQLGKWIGYNPNGSMTYRDLRSGFKVIGNVYSNPELIK